MPMMQGSIPATTDPEKRGWWGEIRHAVRSVPAPLWFVGLALALSGGLFALDTSRVKTVEGWALILSPTTPFFFAKMAYDHWDKFYRWVNFVSAWLFNPTVTWTCWADFEGVRDPDALEKASERLLARFEGAFRRPGTPDARGFTLPTLGAVFLTLHREGHREGMVGFDRELADGRPLLRLEFDPRGDGFRNAVNVLREQLLYVLTDVEAAANAEDTRYALRVVFPGANPYLGMYVRRLPADAVEVFECTIKERVGGHVERVMMGKSRLEFVAPDLMSFRTLGEQYLSLR